MGPYAGKETGETALLRELFGQLRSGDIVLADRFYCSYFLIVMLQQLGIDCVVRLHQCRDYDFQRGRHLGRGDHVVTWIKPQRPDWMDCGHLLPSRASVAADSRNAGAGVAAWFPR